MRRKNRRVPKKLNAHTAAATHFGGLLLVALSVVILKVFASTNCQAISKSIGEKEKELVRLNDAYSREEMLWEEMKTPAQLNAALRRHGLAMKPPRPDQNIHMNADGKPYCGQLAFSRMKRQATTVIAANKRVTNRITNQRRRR